MIKKYLQRFAVVVILLMTALPIQTLAATTLTSPATNLTATFDGSGSGSASTGTVSMTVEGAKTSEKSGTLTLTNSGSEAAILSFLYAATGTYSSFTVAGSSVSASGTYSGELAAGASITIYMSVAKSGIFASPDTGYVNLTNVKLETISAAKLTVSHNEPGTVSIDGTTVESGTTHEVPAEGVTLEATPASGAEFVAWINTADNSVVSTAASFTYVPTGDASIKAIFASASHEACFWGSSKAYLFENLSDAITHATGASNKTVILAASGTLSSGDYTIPSGVTLLAPFDADGTLYTTSPGYVEDSYTKPSAYSTLTMADGANIIVSGAISVSAKVSAKMGYAGAPTSKYGHIAMSEGSSITVNSGANLYAWGFVTGEGTVTVKSGATVYESFQVVDWRGGTASSGMLGNDNKVFPMTQYYVQNVEAATTYEAGSALTCSMIADIISVRIVNVQFFGTSGCIFNLTSGTATKQYDGSTDRLVMDVDGELSISDTEIQLLGDLYKITLSDYVLPINNNITINVNNDATLTIEQDTSLLPGVQMNIAEGGTVTLDSGKRLFVYDETEWKSGYYVYSSSYFRPVRYAHGQSYTRTAAADITDAKILVNGTLDASAGYLYTTASGANICSTGNGVVKVQDAESSPTLYEATQSGTSVSYLEIPITPAKLLNSDNSYEETARAAETLTYTYENGFWKSDAVATIVSQGKDYASLQSAINAYGNDDSYIQMLTDSTAETTIDKTVYLDLNGFDVSNVTVTGTLYGMDSKTNDLGIGNEYGTLEIKDGASNVSAKGSGAHANKYYILCKDDKGVLSFHRVRFGMDSYTYYINSNQELVAITFSATYLGDSVARTAMTGFSMEVNGADMEVDGTGSGFVTVGQTGLSAVTKNNTVGYVLQGTATEITEEAFTVSALLQLSGIGVLESKDYIVSIPDVSDLVGG